MSDEEDDVKRVVRSGKTKVYVKRKTKMDDWMDFSFRHEEIDVIVKKTKHAMRIRDIGLVYECSSCSREISMLIPLFLLVGYENLIKSYEKAKRVFDKEQSKDRTVSFNRFHQAFS